MSYAGAPHLQKQQKGSVPCPVYERDLCLNGSWFLWLRAMVRDLGDLVQSWTWPQSPHVSVGYCDVLLLQDAVTVGSTERMGLWS